MNYPNLAKNALSLINAVNPGPGAYSDANIAAVAQTRAMLHRIVRGELIVTEPPKPDPEILPVDVPE